MANKDEGSALILLYIPPSQLKQLEMALLSSTAVFGFFTEIYVFSYGFLRVFYAFLRAFYGYAFLRVV